MFSGARASENIPNTSPFGKSVFHQREQYDSCMQCGGVIDEVQKYNGAATAIKNMN
jgi:hypothetical protein